MCHLPSYSNLRANHAAKELAIAKKEADCVLVAKKPAWLVELDKLLPIL